MLVSLEVGKVDAGVAVLLTEDKRLIEFPSILLPPDIVSGSIVDVNVSRNLAAEARNAEGFNKLQSEILMMFGSSSPAAPVLRCRNATQTSVVLEWDPISLAQADLRSLSLHRDGGKAGSIPRPTEMTSTKISGLAVDKEYTFSLVLRTTAGTYSSEKLAVRTHKMTDLSGITVTPGIMPEPLSEALSTTVNKIGAKLIDTVRIDTTHFVCTEGRGPAWEKAKEMNIPIVTPDWVIGCEREGRLVSVRGYYLNADPKQRQVGSASASAASDAGRNSFTRAIEAANASPMTPRTPRTEVTPPTPELDRAAERASPAPPPDGLPHRELASSSTASPSSIIHRPPFHGQHGNATGRHAAGHGASERADDETDESNDGDRDGHGPGRGLQDEEDDDDDDDEDDDGDAFEDSNAHRHGHGAGVRHGPGSSDSGGGAGAKDKGEAKGKRPAARNGAASGAAESVENFQDVEL